MSYTTKSLSFDGSTKYVTCGDVLGTLVDRTSTFTISIWVKTSISSAAVMVARQDESSLPSGWDFEIDGTRLTLNIVNTWATNCISTYSDPVVTLNDGNWHHVCCTYDGSGAAFGVSFYIDGVRRGTGITYNNLVSDVYMAGTELTFGRRNISTSYLYFAGNLCQCAMYDRELSQVEVAELYNNGVSANPRFFHSSRSSLKAYWPLGEGDTYPDVLEVVQSPNVPMVAGRKSSYYQLPNDINPGEWCRGVSFRDMAVFYPGPGGDCPFSVNTYGASTLYRAGPINKKLPTDPYSISVWVKYSYTDQRLGNIVTRGIGSSEDGYHLQTDYYFPGAFKFVMRGGNFTGYLKARTTSSGFNDNNWHHLVFTYNGNQRVSGCHLWVDGVDEPLTIEYDNALIAISNASFNIAGWNDTSPTSTSYKFEGLLTQPLFYDVALGSSDVAALYNSGTPVDPTGLISAASLASHWNTGKPDGTADRPGTLTNMNSSNVAAGPGGVLLKALNFNGTNESVSFGNAFNFEKDQYFSFSVLFRTTGSGYLIAKMDNYVGYAVDIDGTGKIGTQISGGSTTRILKQTDVGGYNDGNWHLATVTYNGNGSETGVSFLVDGSAVASTATKNTLSGTLVTTASLTLGVRSNMATGYYSGDIAGAYLHASVLQAADSSALWNGGAPVDPTGLASADYLIGYWKLGEGMYPGTMVGMSSGDIVDDAPYVSSVATEKTWATTANYTLGSSGAPTLSWGKEILLDWKNKLASSGWTVLGSGNSTTYEWSGTTGGPYDVWSSVSDLVWRDSDSGLGAMSWVTLRSPVSAAGQFWITMAFYGPNESCATVYISNAVPDLPGDPLNAYPTPSTDQWFWILDRDYFFHWWSSGFVKSYFSACSDDGSFIMLRSTQYYAKCTCAQMFIAGAVSDLPSEKFPMNAVGYGWNQVTPSDEILRGFRVYIPGFEHDSYAEAISLRYVSTLVDSMPVADSIDGVSSVTPLYLMIRPLSWAASGALMRLCRVPDLWLGNRGLARGSMAPAKTPYSYTNLEGYLWIPGDTVPEFT